MDVQTYFGRHRPGKPDITIRCINAIMRGGIETMDELCEKDEEQLMRPRNFGQKRIEPSITLRTALTRTGIYTFPPRSPVRLL